MSLEDAENHLRLKGFDVTVREEYSDVAPAGEVISQSPSGGSIRENGSTVSIVISRGVHTESSLSDIVTSRTIMIYMIGSDLETEGGLATGDIIEMVASDFDQGWINVVVCTGGARKWSLDFIPNDKVMIYEVTGNEGVTTVGELSVKNMADPQTLTDFLAFCYNSYDTDAYSLIFWNHGSGPLGGFGPDEIYNDILTLADMSEAMYNSPFNRNNKLEIVGFDACLMSSIELAYVFYEYADYLIASQEIILGPGWDYTFLGNLTPEMSAGEIAVEIIDSFFDYYEFVFTLRPDLLTDTTLSCLDLVYVPDVERTLNALYAGMGDNLEISSFTNIARARSRTKEFGRSTTPFLYDLVDLQHLCDLALNDDRPEAQALSEALDNFIVYNRSNTDNANGVSLFYPYSNREYMEIMTFMYKFLGFADDYTEFIEKFVTLLQGDELTSWDLSRSVSMQESDTRFFVQLTPEQVQNYASATYYILMKEETFGEEYMHVFSSADVELKDDGKLYANFAGKTHTLVCPESGFTSHCWMNQVERTDKYITYHVRVGLEDWDLNRFPQQKFTAGWLQLRTDLDGTNLRVMSMIPEIRDVEGISIPLPPIDIYDYSKISFVLAYRLLTYGRDGNLRPFEEWDRPSYVTWREFKLVNESIETFRFVLDDIDRDKDYYIIYSISDIQGNTYSSNMIPISFD